jgi:microcystin-dependent protein
MAEPYVGEVRLFAGNFAMAGFAFANGALLSISQNDVLYNLIGTTYGGDGQNTFQLPNLQSRVPLGQGTGSGLTTRNIGQSGGVENVTLTTSTTPPHQHALFASLGPTTTGVPGPTVLTGALQTTTDGEFYAAPSQAGFSAVAMNATVVGNAGGGQPHNNIQPSIAINYVLALFGIYPTQS